jgi:hypothetical protein
MANNHRTVAVAATLVALVLSNSRAQQMPAPSAATPPKPITYLAPTPENYRKLADEVEAALHHDVLDVWFPRTVDEKNGGFRADFNRDWTPGAKSGGKFSVFQGRMTWISSQVAMRRPEFKDKFLPNTACNT